MNYFWDVSNHPYKVLSKNKIKLIKSLDLKKNRLTTGLFVAEGKKLVFDLLKSDIVVSELFCSKLLASEIIGYKQNLEIEIIDKEELSRISYLKTTPDIVGIFNIPKSAIDWNEIKDGLTLVLDTIQDPGNLGTIVRLADWFGIHNIICSTDCADLYNPKVVQSTMGALARVKVHYVALPEFLSHAKQLGIKVYGTFMEGENLYKCDLTDNGLIVMGNEGNGISENITAYISTKINIPSYPSGVVTSESLNVAIATSIICSEFRRRIICKG
ncbi:MAG TPA: RNA methyltransferase [Prolixibacteraceae bacterium]|jgi:TrmH family RNA methyltransferase